MKKEREQGETEMFSLSPGLRQGFAKRFTESSTQVGALTVPIYRWKDKGRPDKKGGREEGDRRGNKERKNRRGRNREEAEIA